MCVSFTFCLLLVLQFVFQPYSAAFTESNLVYAQCVAKCADKYVELGRSFVDSGEVVRNVLLTHNNSNFSLCRAGCALPASVEIWFPAFRDGQLFLTLAKANRVAEIDAPVGVEIMCREHVREQSSVDFMVNIAAANKTHALFALEVTGWGSNIDDSLFGDVIHVAYSFCCLAAISLRKLLNIRWYRIRAVTVTVEGISLSQASSRLYSSEEIFSPSYPRTVPFVRSQELERNSVTVLIGWEVLGSTLPSCSLTLEWSDKIFFHRQTFKMDSSYSFAVSGLRFDQNYTLRLSPSSALGNSNSSLSKLAHFSTSSCIQLVDDPGLCAPLPVSNITWQTLSLSSVRISWVYIPLYEENKLPNSTATYRQYYFLLSFVPMVTIQRSQCQYLRPFQMNIPSTQTSVDVNITEALCNYEVTITVIDWLNRSSEKSVFRKIAPYNTSQRTIGTLQVVLLITSLVSLIVVAGVVCFLQKLLDGYFSKFRCDTEEYFKKPTEGGFVHSAASRSKHWSLSIPPELFASSETWADEEKESQRGNGHRIDDVIYTTKGLDDSADSLSQGSGVPDLSFIVSCVPSAYSLFRRSMQQRSCSEGVICTSLISLSDNNGEYTTQSYPRSHAVLRRSPESPSVFGSSPCVFGYSALPASSNSSSSQKSSVDSKVTHVHTRSKMVKLIPMSSVEIIKILGCGSFATVFRVKIEGRFAALKTAHQGRSFGPRKKRYLLREAQMSLDMCTSRHENIVQLLAFCYGTSDFSELHGLVFECCEGGDLKRLLIRMRKRALELQQFQPNTFLGRYAVDADLAFPLNRQVRVVKELANYAHQIARAMEFISCRRYIHRDVAARNVLLLRAISGDPFETTPGQIVKLTDFGLCVPLGDSKEIIQIRRSKLPFKLLPYEFWVDNTYGLEGDVWEYGCLLIEIVTLGNDPGIVIRKDDLLYPRADFEEYVQSVSSGFSNLDAFFGHSLQPVIRRALNRDKSQRMNFTEICEHFVTLLRNNSGSA